MSAGVVNYKVLNPEIACKTKIYVEPIEQHYEESGETPYIKYTCPVCKALRGTSNQLMSGQANCLVCGVNLWWERIMAVREILFRGKRVGNGEWVEGDLFNDGFVNSSRRFIGGILIEDYEGSADDEFVITGMDFYEVDPSTICQYTGLTDKNKQKIWENDIVQNKSKWGDWMGCVVFRNGSFVVDWKIFKKKSDRGVNAFTEDIINANNAKEVVGNVFDNPELLK